MFTTVAVPHMIEVWKLQRKPNGMAALPFATLDEIADQALEIRTYLGNVDEEYVLQRLAVLSSLQRPLEASAAAQRACMPTTTGVKFGSLVSFGADVDFGIPGTTSGYPRWCRKPWMHDEGMINILPRKGGTSGDTPWEILVCLPEKTIKLMLKWEELGQFVDRWVNDGDPLDFVKRKALLPGRHCIYLDGTQTRLAM